MSTLELGNIVSGPWNKGALSGRMNRNFQIMLKAMYGFTVLKVIPCDEELLAGLKLACIKRRWLNGYKWPAKKSLGSGINSKQVILWPERSAKVATENPHLHRIDTCH
ncbi:hypothetical protein TNCV_5128011 [Trichonephila clavipes]|nr:hypothetical protein TNCV_5128011 [Trichonephila clavipes]